WAAACRRASHRSASQRTSVHFCSAACGLMSAWSLSNCVASIGSAPRVLASAISATSRPHVCFMMAPLGVTGVMPIIIGPRTDRHFREKRTRAGEDMPCRPCVIFCQPGGSLLRNHLQGLLDEALAHLEADLDVVPCRLDLQRLEHLLG